MDLKLRFLRYFCQFVFLDRKYQSAKTKSENITASPKPKTKKEKEL